MDSKLECKYVAIIDKIVYNVADFKNHLVNLFLE